MKAQSTVNVAVVGLGFMGVTHLHAYLRNPHARVVAVCGKGRLPRHGVLPGVAGNIKQPDDVYLGSEVKVSTEIEDVIADSEVDLVDICTPTPLHHDQAIAALRAGKHVLCEKPLARTSASAREIVDVANHSPGLLMPAMCMRFWPGWNWLKQVVDEEPYGKVQAAHFRRLSAMPMWSKQGTSGPDVESGGALFDLHIHDTDFVSFLFGRPISVFSAGVLDLDGSIHHVMTQYNYARELQVSAEGSWLLADGFHLSYDLHCERATLDYDGARGPEALLITEPGKGARVEALDEVDGYEREIEYLLQCVTSGQPPETVAAGDGVTALEICEAEEQSIRTGQLISL